MPPLKAEAAPDSYLISIIKQKRKERGTENALEGEGARSGAMPNHLGEWGTGPLPTDGSKLCLRWIAGECWRSFPFPIMKSIPGPFCWCQQEQLSMGESSFLHQAPESRGRWNPKFMFHGEDADGDCGFWSPVCAGRSGSISKPALNVTTNALC